ncbi:winged helix-turn-helix domain-containing protein [Virgisporangium ochraceum]|uniref:Transcriptional regulator n=1 Tax=Virgisporangium ochraceum TaxID=65505 RepID=A0A8J4E9Y8_9ACTN|nr:metalloregulator ArsR/SmtB family transcription factor [Virgisporangium ochraceum]GIJ66823.1 transcriptional regulator [Virgisporangium ochraceum]
MQGDELVRLLTALASPQRLRILAALVEGRKYVTELARQVGLSRPLVHAHLTKLAAAGLVTSELELAEEGHGIRYVQVSPFALHLTPELIAEAVATMSDKEKDR